MSGVKMDMVPKAPLVPTTMQVCWLFVLRYSVLNDWL